MDAESLRDDLSQGVKDMLMAMDLDETDYGNLDSNALVAEAQQHAMYTTYVRIVEPKLGRKPFAEPKFYTKDLQDFNTWIEKDKQETVYYKAIIAEAVASPLWKNHVTIQTTGKNGAEPEHYEQLAKEPPEDTDWDEEVSLWVQSVRCSSDTTSLAVGGATKTFMNNIKDAMPDGLRDHLFLTKYLELDGARFTLMKNVESDAHDFQKWLDCNNAARTLLPSESAQDSQDCWTWLDMFHFCLTSNYFTSLGVLN